MKSIMIKSICTIIAVSIIVLACSHSILNFSEISSESSLQPNFDQNGYWDTPDFKFKKNPDNSFIVYGKNSVYGAYLAGRVAHLRQDFINAAEYYKIVMDKDKDNAVVNRAIYVILSSLGQINEAYPYAEQEKDDSKKQTLAPLVISLKNFADGNYEEARQNIGTMNDNLHTILINPLFNAWAYAGENNEEKAISSLKNLEKDKTLASMKLFHEAMIYDYLGNKEMARKSYETIIQNYPQEVTYRYLEIITDFYIRSGDKEMARKVSGVYNDSSMLSILLKNIDRNIDIADSNAKPIIDAPRKGLAEAMFNIGTLFRLSAGGAEFAQIYIAAASFLNPDYDISKIAMANVLEELGLYKEANRYYEQIKPESGSYFIAQIKMIENLNTLKDYQGAEKNLRRLLKQYPDNTQLLTDLGDIIASQKKFDEAINVYLQAVQKNQHPQNDMWPLYYSLAVAYHRNNQQEQAEKYMLQALDLSQRNPNVLNYLGYMWLEDNRNTDEAIQMILDAYAQLPYEGHILDSIGWVYYRIGNYERAIEFLEQASDMNSGNAVISDHLGDAYWFIGRKNEAVFQWKHALVLKEDSDSIDKKAIKDKIENSNIKNSVITIKNQELLKKLEELALPSERD